MAITATPPPMSSWWTRCPQAQHRAPHDERSTAPRTTPRELPRLGMCRFAARGRAAQRGAAAAAGCCWQSRRDRRPNGRRDAIGTSLTTVQHRKPPSARLRKAAVTRTSHQASPLRRMPVVSVNSTAAVAWRISESVKSHGRWHETTCTTTAPEHKTSKWHRKNLN